MSLLRALFWAALLGVCWLLLAPAGSVGGGLAPPWDKLAHGLVFFSLGVLALGAFPSASLLRLGLWLAVFAGATELAQAAPLLGRSADPLDGVADLAGLGLALGLARATGRR